MPGRHGLTDRTGLPAGGRGVVVALAFVTLLLQLVAAGCHNPGQHHYTVAVAPARSVLAVGKHFQARLRLR